MGTLDVVIRAHDPARLDELDRAVFSAALSEHRPLSIHIACQRFDAAALASVAAMLEPLRAVVPDVRFAVLNRPDPLPVDARAALLNLGLRAGTGRFVAFLDYDDVIYPEAYRLLIAELRDSGAAIAFGGVLNADVTRAGLVPITLAKRRVYAGSGLRQLLHDNFCPLHSFVLDRGRIGAAELRVDEDLVQLEDYDLLLRVCARHRSSFRLKDVIIGEYVFKDDGSNANPLAMPDADRSRWLQTAATVAERKQRLVVAADVLAELGITEPGLSVAAVLDRLPPSG